MTPHRKPEGIYNWARPEWRNWQTRRTQNPVGFTPRVGSTPSSGTKISAPPAESRANPRVDAPAPRL